MQACAGKPLPDQVLPFDRNDGAGFWWANSLNAFTRNVAAECDEYGFRFEAAKTAAFDPVLKVRRPDGSRAAVDVRTLPFVRFEGNEAHCQRRHAFNLGGMGAGAADGVGGIGPDARHPFVVKDFTVWNSHWAFHTLAASVAVDGLTAHDVEYGLWRIAYKRHAYRGIELTGVSVKEEFMPTGARPQEADFPKPLDPVDDRPPATVVTHLLRAGGRLTVRGTTSDGGPLRRVVVNGREATLLPGLGGEWEAALPADTAAVTAFAEDAAGNVEATPHTLAVGQ